MLEELNVKPILYIENLWQGTQLNCIATVIRPTDGSIQINRHSLQALKGKALAEYHGKTLGYLFQNFELHFYLLSASKY